MLSLLQRSHFAHLASDRAVRSFLQSHPIEVFQGQVTVEQVVQYAVRELLQLHIIPTQAAIRDIYDLIYAYGPEHEQDVHWLAMQGWYIYNGCFVRNGQALTGCPQA